MRETQEIVINTSPIIAIVAATGDLRILQMYERVLVPHEVVGVLLRAKRTGYQFPMRHAIERMRKRGIWLSDRVVAFALSEAGEDDDD